MPEIDMNKLKNSDPLAFHRMMKRKYDGELRLLREGLSDAQNSVERDKAQRAIDRLKAEADHHRGQIEKLDK